MLVAAALPAAAETLRIATYNVELTRRGPGLLLRDIQGGKDAQVAAVRAVLSATEPDILLLTGFDYDLGLRTLGAFNAGLAAPYPYLFALRPNTGWMTDVDLDGDGRLRGPGDAQGFGRYPGEGGMAVLSRFPPDAAAVQDFSTLLWRDLPGALIGGAGLSPEAADVQRLSTTGHWDVPVILPGDRVVRLLAWHATPPVFDGPEDRNGRRNHDENTFWRLYLDGAVPGTPPSDMFVLLGDSNLDPADGEGRREAVTTLLTDPRLQDPAPRSEGGAALAGAVHTGDPALDTADWPEDGGPGNMRVDLVLPSADLTVTGTGVWWPKAGEAADTAALASRHRLVWVDIEMGKLGLDDPVE